MTDSSEKEEFKPDEPCEKILNVINNFRGEPKKYLDKKESVKKRKQKEYEDFINSLEKMPELKPDKELCELQKK